MKGFLGLFASVALGGVVASSVAILGCNAIMDLGRFNESVSASDAGGLGTDAGAASDAAGDGGPDWSCMGGPIPTAPATARLKLFLNDVSSAQSSGSYAGTPIVGAVIRSCTPLDFACASPLDSGVSDDAGLVSMIVPGGFDGYYELTQPSFTQSILSRPPQLKDESAQQGMASASLLSLGAAAAGVTDDPSLSVVIVSAADCGSNPAPGVTFQVVAPGPKQKIVYIENSLPTASATETDASGSAVIFNVSPGTFTLAATIVSSGRTIRSVTTLARTGWITFIQVRLDQARVIPF